MVGSSLWFSLPFLYDEHLKETYKTVAKKQEGALKTKGKVV